MARPARAWLKFPPALAANRHSRNDALENLRHSLAFRRKKSVKRLGHEVVADARAAKQAHLVALMYREAYLPMS